jgi:hypothetical protein
MAGFIAVPLTTEVKIFYQSGANLYENVIHYKYTGSPPTVANLTSLCNAVIAGVAEKLRLAMWNGVTMIAVEATNLEVDTANQATVQFPTNTHGARAGSVLASNEACSIVKRTGLSGRGMHGRMSVSSFIEGDADGNSLGSTLIALLTNIALELLVPYVGGLFTGALAKKHPHIGSPVSIPLQSAGVLDSNVDSQKTRLNSHGR